MKTVRTCTTWFILLIGPWLLLLESSFTGSESTRYTFFSENSVFTALFSNVPVLLDFALLQLFIMSQIVQSPWSPGRGGPGEAQRKEQSQWKSHSNAGAFFPGERGNMEECPPFSLTDYIWCFNAFLSVFLLALLVENFDMILCHVCSHFRLVKMKRMSFSCLHEVSFIVF